mgnify:CR=1 FL=1
MAEMWNIADRALKDYETAKKNSIQIKIQQTGGE